VSLKEECIMGGLVSKGYPFPISDNKISDITSATRLSRGSEIEVVRTPPLPSKTLNLSFNSMDTFLFSEE
jgi:hypothetical protein